MGGRGCWWHPCARTTRRTLETSRLSKRTHGTRGRVQPPDLDLDSLLMIYLEFWNLELAYIKVLVMGLRNDPETAVSQQQLWS